MMSLIVAVIRIGDSVFAAGGAAGGGDEHAAATTSDTPASTSQWKVRNFIQNPLTLRSLVDGRRDPAAPKRRRAGLRGPDQTSRLYPLLSRSLPRLFRAAWSANLTGQSAVSWLVERSAPLPAVGRPGDRAHPQAMIFGVAARVARDDDVVARFERFAGDTLAVQLQAGTPFDRVPHHLSLRVFAFDVHERMRVTEEELHQF